MSVTDIRGGVLRVKRQNWFLPDTETDGLMGMGGGGCAQCRQAATECHQVASNHRYTKIGIGNVNRKLQELLSRSHASLAIKWHRYLIKQIARECGGPRSSESAMFWNS